MINMPAKVLFFLNKKIIWKDNFKKTPQCKTYIVILIF